MKKQLTGERWLDSSSKRRFDVAFSLALLGPAVGIGVFSAAALYLEKPTKPWFKQLRVGQDGAHFDIHKLRTMTATDFYDASTGTHDYRRTAVGKILGVAGIDELPQLLNVLQDDMSIVGPRPLPTVVVDDMRDVLSETEFNEWFRAYTFPKPGLTSQFSNVSRNLDPQTDEYLLTRAEMDIAYISNASRAFDTKLIVESGALAISRLASLLG
jgi:lipopolysaccharide/colanic/teichoic acid biosynthesis glycosyltransferase